MYAVHRYSHTGVPGMVVVVDSLYFSILVQTKKILFILYFGCVMAFKSIRNKTRINANFLNVTCLILCSSPNDRRVVRLSIVQDSCLNVKYFYPGYRSGVTP